MNSRFLLFSLVLTISLLPAQTIPGRYIVELSTEPVIGQILPGGDATAMAGVRAAPHRARIQAEQDRFRTDIEATGSRVLGTVNTVANALFVEASEAEAQRLARMPGVKRVVPERRIKLLLDRTAVVHKVDQVWAQIGESNGGAGIKVAVVDTGMENTHPVFQSDLAIPEGYPKYGAQADATYTNNKIIVARSYVNLLQYPDPDYTPADHIGHGTALGAAVAGVRTNAPLAVIQGMAPAAQLGNYKVFGTPGWNDYSNASAIVKAIDDAVADGMDVISISIGSDLAQRFNYDFEVAAVERAAKAGVIVVIAAGNNGNDLNTIASPGTAPSAITVGATSNQRSFGRRVEVSDLTSFLAYAGNGPEPAAPVSGLILDVSTVDSDGRACNTLQSDSLAGRVTLILRGNCNFETKLENARNAGAIGAIVYAAPESPSPIHMNVGLATLPAEMISNEDSMTIKKVLADGASPIGTLHFEIGPVPTPALRLADFSAAGPNVDLAIKPDVVAVGENFYTATQTLDYSGTMYDDSGYTLADGTSFATPAVAGVAALVKAARPGLTVDQYRSLIINTAMDAQTLTGGKPAVQQSGAGAVDALAALHSPLTATPVSLGLGAGGADLNATQTLTLYNIGSQTDTFTITATSDDGAVPEIATPTVEVAPGASVQVPLRWTLTGLLPGPHQGFILATSTAGASIRVPFWYAATSDPVKITIVDASTAGTPGSKVSDAVLFRVTDVSGVPLAEVAPEVTVTAGAGVVDRLRKYDIQVPGLFGIDVILDTIPGFNTFRIKAGEIVRDVTILGR